MKLSLRTIDGVSKIDAAQWRRLERKSNPFLSWAFLNCLEESGSVAGDNGWQPHHLCVFEGEDLVAAAPTYIKSHSRGEFVFDWAWADAYHRSQLNYYPKLLTAVPWTPVSGPRLLVARDHPAEAELRMKLVELGIEQCGELGLSSWHCNFIDGSDRGSLVELELLERTDCQFHWHNRGYSDFREFLFTLKAKKRKNIRQERRSVKSAGVSFKFKTGGELEAHEIEFVFACYQRTFLAHGNYPALNIDCFRQMAATMPGSLLVNLARRNGELLAMSAYFLEGEALYGRYWGTVEDLPGLHFETAYYQGIEYCIRNGLKRFESGAQGEHKIARGFEPVTTRSFHYIAHPGFRLAISEYLRKEAEWVSGYRGEVERHQPFHARMSG